MLMDNSECICSASHLMRVKRFSKSLYTKKNRQIDYRLPYLGKHVRMIYIYIQVYKHVLTTNLAFVFQPKKSRKFYQLLSKANFKESYCDIVYKFKVCICIKYVTRIPSLATLAWNIHVQQIEDHQCSPSNMSKALWCEKSIPNTKLREHCNNVITL